MHQRWPWNCACVQVPPRVYRDLVTLPQPGDRFHYLGRRQREGYSSVEEVSELSDSHRVRPRLPESVPISPSLPSSRDYPSSREIPARPRSVNQPEYPSKGKSKGDNGYNSARPSPRCAMCAGWFDRVQECPQNPRNRMYQARDKGYGKGGKGQDRWEGQGTSGGWHRGSRGRGTSSTKGWKGEKGSKGKRVKPFLGVKVRDLPSKLQEHTV